MIGLNRPAIAEVHHHRLADASVDVEMHHRRVGDRARAPGAQRDRSNHRGDRRDLDRRRHAEGAGLGRVCVLPGCTARPARRSRSPWPALMTTIETTPSDRPSNCRTDSRSRNTASLADLRQHLSGTGNYEAGGRRGGRPAAADRPAIEARRSRQTMDARQQGIAGDIGVLRGSARKPPGRGRRQARGFRLEQTPAPGQSRYATTGRASSRISITGRTS